MRVIIDLPHLLALFAFNSYSIGNCLSTTLECLSNIGILLSPSVKTTSAIHHKVDNNNNNNNKPLSHHQFPIFSLNSDPRHVDPCFNRRPHRSNNDSQVPTKRLKTNSTNPEFKRITIIILNPTNRQDPNPKSPIIFAILYPNQHTEWGNVHSSKKRLHHFNNDN